MSRRTAILILAAGALVLGACGNDRADVAETGAGPTTTTTEAETTSTTEAEPVGLEQPAIWPAADVVFATPEEAAADFVREVLGVPPVLGEFQGGDSRSGEMEVLSPNEGGGAATTRGLLLLRQLGPDDGWFILAAVNDAQSIATPASRSTVAAGPLTVEGAARGFEATVLVSAHIAGQSGDPLDLEISAGGSQADPEPFTAELDLSGAESGDTVLLLVRGGTGLENDPGEFAAIPVVIE